MHLPRPLVVLAAFSTLALAGCSGSSSSNAQATGGGASTTPSSAPSTSAPSTGASTQAAGDSTTPSDSTSASAASDGLKVGKVGFGRDKSAGSGLPDYLWAVAIVHNGTDQITGIDVSFSAYDADGKVVGQSDTSAPILRAGMTMPVGTQVEVPAGTKVAKVVATVDHLEGLSQKDDHPDSHFTTKNVHVQQSDFGTKVLGDLVSAYQQKVRQVYLSAACYDASGKIIGGGEDYVNSIGPGQTVGFAIDSVIVSSKPDHCEVGATLSAASTGS